MILCTAKEYKLEKFQTSKLVKLVSLKIRIIFALLLNVLANLNSDLNSAHRFQ